MYNWRYAVDGIQLLRERLSVKKEKKFKVHAAIVEDYLSNDNQYGHKRKR